MLSGNDNVDHWSDQSVWNAALKNIRIVLSTHQVLLDALTHAFVKLSKLAVIIFDEGACLILNSIVVVFSAYLGPSTSLHYEASRKPYYERLL
jgi:hypothetical protein